MTDSFFNEQTEQSNVKSEIVSKYFDVWAKIIMGSQDRFGREKKIAYIDLFSGPGRYENGTISTPLKILNKAISDEKYCERLVCMFNDKDEKNSSSLESEISNLEGIEKLKYQPEVHNNDVGEEIVKMFEEMNLIPTLFFVDPWGYKGLSLRLINSVLKDWGCDCIFFLNYNRINMGITNKLIASHINSLFGEERANTIRKTFENENLTPSQREYHIIEEICNSLKEMGGKYTLPFRFKNNKGGRTSHHLIFVSKHHIGYSIMKEIMAKESSSKTEGVASFEYNPVDSIMTQGLLFQLSRPISELGNELLTVFSGRTLKMIEIFNEHNVDTPFISRNYKDALIKLEEEGKISVSKHRKGTFGDNVQVTFP